ncbi:hypothetical protein AM1_1115 [Acaryochloris marina MBIC11017]|uniref:Uncharacterized protein n=1 Tax=Acaryochloris marina (strain MBIC 11017) TaxID=329726 RepID=B0C2T8_ACAM1|nr:hypothetical protein AM1_1115 [Acaryochloris marina MBIC11017]
MIISIPLKKDDVSLSFNKNNKGFSWDIFPENTIDASLKSGNCFRVFCFYKKSISPSVK